MKIHKMYCYMLIGVFNSIVTLFSGLDCHVHGDKRLTPQKIDSVFEKYIAAVKKLSADFPNHQIELHLDIAGTDVPRPQGRLNYIHLRKPTPLTEKQKRGVRSAVVNTTQAPKTPVASPTDPEMQPVYMKDLKKAIEDLEKKYSKQSGFEGSQPSSTQEIKSNVNIKQIMQLLGKGTLITPDLPKLPEDNVSWFQIKIPTK